MSIKKIAVYQSGAWSTQDIGADAANITVNGGADGDLMYVNNGTLAHSSQVKLDNLTGLTGNVQTQLNTLNSNLSNYALKSTMQYFAQAASVNTNYVKKNELASLQSSIQQLQQQQDASNPLSDYFQIEDPRTISTPFILQLTYKVTYNQLQKTYPTEKNVFVGYPDPIRQTAVNTIDVSAYTTMNYYRGSGYGYLHSISDNNAAAIVPDESCAVTGIGGTKDNNGTMFAPVIYWGLYNSGSTAATTAAGCWTTKEKVNKLYSYLSNTYISLKTSNDSELKIYEFIPSSYIKTSSLTRSSTFINSSFPMDGKIYLKKILSAPTCYYMNYYKMDPTQRKFKIPDWAVMRYRPIEGFKTNPRTFFLFGGTKVGLFKIPFISNNSTFSHLVITVAGTDTNSTEQQNYYKRVQLGYFNSGSSFYQPVVRLSSYCTENVLNPTYDYISQPYALEINSNYQEIQLLENWANNYTTAEIYSALSLFNNRFLNTIFTPIYN